MTASSGSRADPAVAVRLRDRGSDALGGRWPGMLLRFVPAMARARLFPGHATSTYPMRLASYLDRHQHLPRKARRELRCQRTGLAYCLFREAAPDYRRMEWRYDKAGLRSMSVELSLEKHWIFSRGQRIQAGPSRSRQLEVFSGRIFGQRPALAPLQGWPIFRVYPERCSGLSSSAPLALPWEHAAEVHDSF
jgi:hypothetical protein